MSIPTNNTTVEFVPNVPKQREFIEYEGYERRFLLPTKNITPYVMPYMHRKTLRIRPRYLNETERAEALNGQQDFLLEYEDDSHLRALYFFQKYFIEGTCVSYKPTPIGTVGDYNKEIIKSKMFGKYYNQLWVTRYSSVVGLDGGQVAYLDHDILVAEKGMSRVTVTFDSLEAMGSFDPLYYFGPEITGLPGQSLRDYALEGGFIDPIGEEIYYSI